MLRPGMTQEWVGKGELPKERTQSKVTRPYDVLAKATYGEIFIFSSTKENCSKNTKVLKQVVKMGEEATSPKGLSYPKAKRRSKRRWTRRSVTVPQRRIYRSRRKRCRYKATDSRVMGLVTSWYRRALVVKGAEEVENAEANSKYQDKAKIQRPKNFIRSMSTGFLSR
ncbi:hypothetical protein B296_00045280 [Ensete ventricosum]|uniref:Uncharacterized protein n=1 Tax=Ensete ventricosum TaxID=4639 RepID=A0A426YW61_ENSVE|nr:hypothetical protein B296_00045280 [Ensete ventricosum]